MSITGQLTEFRDLLREMRDELRQVRALLQLLVDGQKEPGNCITFTMDKGLWAETLARWEHDD